MVSFTVVLLLVATVLVPATSYALVEPENRGTPRRRVSLLVQFGSMALVTSLIGFEGTFGLVADPGVPEIVGTGVLVGSVGAFLVAGWLWSQ